MKRSFLFLCLVMLMATGAMAQQRCLTPEFEQARLRLYEAYGGSEGPTPMRSDVAVHDVGDTVTFWSWDLTRQPPVWELVPSTCRAVTANSYIFVADDQWNVHMDSADVAVAAYYWEEGTYIDSTAGIYQLDTENFGQPPDELDNDNHIYIFYDALGSYHGIVFDGYFSVFNEYTEEQAQGMGGHSNEVEMFYMSCYPGDPVSPIRTSVLAHEFEHMIHWAHDADEATWVDEGCAEYAMLLFGVPDPLIDFPTQPDNDLTVWGNSFADYVQTLLFFTYLSDHFGGPATLTAVVADPLNSIDGIESALLNRGYDVVFADVFTDWVIANYYHGGGGSLLPQPDSQYLYYSLNPPAFANSDWIEDYPAGPNERHVSRWAADYIRFNNVNRNFNSLDLRFDGDVSGEFACALFSDSIPSGFAVTRLVLSSGSWQGTDPAFWYRTNEVLMVAGMGGVTDYTYSADALTGIDEAEELLPRLEIISLYPNPFNSRTLIKFSKTPGESATLRVFDIAGRLLSDVALEPFTGGGQIVWEGEDLSGKGVASGIYLFRLSGEGRSAVVKGTLLK